MSRHSVLLLLLLFLYDSESKKLIRKTEYGPVRGLRKTSIVNPNTKYLAFKGIPYAKPPVGKLRFMDPQPPEKWTEVKNATRDPEVCAQAHFVPGINEFIGSEDCLYLNVFVSLKKKKPLPVMFWIYGGGSTSGSCTEYGPDYLIEEPVVIVTFQYRVGIFGFLSSQDENIKGNMALKDQVLALKWVKNNIENFGGDPDRITVFGESAGASYADLMTLSPLSKDLFHGCITESGSSLTPWSVLEDPKPVFWKVMTNLNFNEQNISILVEKLQSADYKTLLSVSNETFTFLDVLNGYSGWHAVIEIETKGAFLTEHPYTILKSGNFSNIPYMSGYNTKEGGLFTSTIDQAIKNIDQNEKSLILIPSNIFASNNIDVNQTVNEIESYYFTNDANQEKLLKFASFQIFVHGIRDSVKFHAKVAPTYLYKFSYPGGTPLVNPGDTGHCQELQFLWMCNFFALGMGNITNPNPSKEEILTRNRMVRLWTNFATYGNPTPFPENILQNVTWPQVNKEESISMLNIGVNLEVISDPDETDVRFWEKLYGTNL